MSQLYGKKRTGVRRLTHSMFACAATIGAIMSRGAAAAFSRRARVIAPNSSSIPLPRAPQSQPEVSVARRYGK
jgi:hypothetical protein